MPTVETFERDALGYFIRKRPGESKPYGFDWTNRLAAGVQVTGSSFSLSAWSGGGQVAKGAEGTDGARTWVWISGGEVGQECEFVNTIQYSDGRSDERRARIKVVP